MRDVERLTLLAGHVASVAAAINYIAQEVDLIAEVKPKRARELVEMAINLSFVEEHLIEELQEICETILPSLKEAQPA